nr:replication protein A 70 kDa DNA-binding subunit B [Tanacetum cinerariifolium]
MARFDNGFISDLTAVRDNIILRVRIVRIWMQPMRNNPKVINMELIIMDEQYSINHQPQIIHEDQEWISKLNHEFIESIRSMFEEFHERLQAANISTHTPEPSRHFNSFYNDDDDDDYEERSRGLSFNGDEDLSTIPEKESNEVIKSSVEDLVPILSESEDTFGSDSEYDLSFCDDFSPIDVPEGKFVTFSNPLFDSNDDFTSSDDESLSYKDVPKDNVKFYSNPLFEFNDEYISSDVNPLFDEVLENIENKDSYHDEPDLLVTPFFDANEDECLDPGGDVDEIELLLHHTPSTLKMSVASILEGYTNEPPLEENDDLFDLGSKENKWKKIFYDAPINDLMTEDKVFDPRIHEKKFSPTYVSLPFEDRHYFFFTYVIRIFLPYFTYPMDSPFLLSFGSEDTIFDPDIPAFHFLALIASHQSGTFISFNVYPYILNESLMEIFSSTRFNPNITMIWGESS